ncbi:molecular chaperone DnaJ [Kitasatospora sp. Ki12]
MRTAATDHYAVLGIRPDADLATIRRAYRVCVRHAHPDRRPAAEAARAHEDMARINLAFEILSDPGKRATYDASRRSSARAPRQEPPPPPPRSVIWTPPVIDFGEVAGGQRSAERAVTIRFADGAMIRRAIVLDESGLFWFVGPAEFRDIPEVTLHLYSQRIPPDAPVGPATDQLRVQLDEVTATLDLTVTIVEPAPQPTPPPPAPATDPKAGDWYRHPVRWLVGVLVILAVVVLAVGGTKLLGLAWPHHSAAPRPAATGSQASGSPAAAPNPVVWQVGPLVENTSPVPPPRVTVTGHRLYEAAGSSDGRTVIRAVDLESGRALWQSAHAAGPPQASWAAAPDVTAGVVVSESSTGFFGLDAESGQVKWDQSWPGGLASSVKPVVASGLVVVADGLHGRLHAFRADTGASVWSTALARSSPVQSLAADGHALVAMEDGAAQALDLATGRILWMQDLGQLGGEVQLAGIAGGRALLGTSDGIEARSLATGQVVWQVPLVGHLNLWPIVSDQIFLAHVCLGGCTDGTPQQEVAYDAATGRQLWTSTAAWWEIDRPPAESLVGSTLLHWADESGNAGLWAVDSLTGRTVWSATPALEPIFAAADEQRVFVIGADGSVVALRR